MSQKPGFWGQPLPKTQTKIETGFLGFLRETGFLGFLRQPLR
ncbi:hypothetical protein [Planktothricoides raciborskii]|uniref:Uncharacterized protein n=1 Tax=Planktothricoides raciborskii GIHE-MW2 TaxID=2792601 RepID=A0AAU8JHE9_9CYAN